MWKWRFSIHSIYIYVSIGIVFHLHGEIRHFWHHQHLSVDFIHAILYVIAVFISHVDSKSISFPGTTRISESFTYYINGSTWIEIPAICEHI
jgi:hypothetical protein